MPEMFAVEDGTGVAGANAYRSPADVSLYFEAVIGAAPEKWTLADDPLRQAWCRFCSRWLDDYMRGRLPGRVSSTSRNRLLFPREDCYDSEGRLIEGVPEEVPDTVCDLIVLHLAKPLNTVLARGGAIQSVKAGSVEVVWRGDAPGGRDFSWIDVRLSGFIAGNSPSVDLEKEF